MINKRDSIETLKIKLKSCTKLKLQRERELNSVHNEEASLQREFTTYKSENLFLKEQLEEIKSLMGQFMHQISMINICSTSEKSKITEHIIHLQDHRKGFDDYFKKGNKELESDLQQQRNKAQEDAVLAVQENIRLQSEDLSKLKESRAREIATLEAECRNIEAECAIFKKRNNAIMLKLRRKLLETENIRREIIRRTENTPK